jgi:hypothetical protein
VIQLTDRAIRLVGINNSQNEFAPNAGACCDVNGQPASYASVVGARVLAQLGLDRHGRLWLAWTPGRQGPKQQARIVELDPQTLKPRGEVGMVPGFRGFVTIRALVCTDICRLVVEGYAATRPVVPGLTAVSWARGERSPTKIRFPVENQASNGGLIAARDDAGRLAVAYWGDSSETQFTVGLARGDARGANLRAVSAIQEPTRLGSFSNGVQLNSSVNYGALARDGYAAAAVYTGGGGSSGYRAILRVAILSLRR